MPDLQGTCVFPSLDSLNFIEYDFGTRHAIAPADVVTVHQIHSTRVVSNRGMARCQEDADALIENTPGLAIGVKTADCVPVLLADPVNHSVAAIHAGWRGTAHYIVQVAIRAMAVEFGTQPNNIRAAIGPCIGPCCYEVGPDVATEFGVVASGHVHLDLANTNARQLEAAGILAHHISTSGLCTKCNPDAYYSFRRDREAAGRMISWIRIRPLAGC